MALSPKIRFGNQYRAALRRGTSRPIRSPILADSVLGRLAVSAGTSQAELTRIHRKALLSQERAPGIQRKGVVVAGSNRESPALQRTTSDLTKSRVELALLAKIIKDRDVALEDTRKHLRAEVGLRRISSIRLRRKLRASNLLLVESRRLQAQSNRLARRAFRALEEERKEISRDLHDGVAQTLSGISLKLEALKTVAASDSKEFWDRISQTQQLVTESVRIVHRFARELRPSMLDDIGLIPALRAYIRDLHKPTKLEILFTAFPAVEELNNLRRTVLYRVVQEALTNIVRHAGAKHVVVTITKTAHGAKLRISDDGKSFSVAESHTANGDGRLGLLGMQERVEMVGGSFSITSTPERGTVIFVEIPAQGKARKRSR